MINAFFKGLLRLPHPERVRGQCSQPRLRSPGEGGRLLHWGGRVGLSVGVQRADLSLIWVFKLALFKIVYPFPRAALLLAKPHIHAVYKFQLNCSPDSRV